MIPAELSTICWADIEGLIAVGREEDDAIEFKRSFKGSDDYLALGDRLKEQALDAIAREAIAFLNTRGGDIVIGLRDAGGAHPRAEAITPIKNPQETADRLARGLSAVIEPAQTNLSVRALSSPDDPKTGIVIVRARASLRAPHRSKRTLEAFARRGSESVPMAMDEIQDLTLYRTRIRTEQLDLLDRQFIDFRQGRSGQHVFPSPVFQIMATVLPFAEQDLEIEDTVLAAFNRRPPSVVRADGTVEHLDVAFRGLTGRWRPMLRGKKREDLYSHETRSGEEIQFSSKRVNQNGMLTFEYAVARHGEGGEARIYLGWLIGFLAQVTDDLAELAKIRPATLPATLRLAVRADGIVYLISGARYWETANQLPSGFVAVPDFSISTLEDLNSFFEYAQLDLLSLCELDGPAPYSLNQQESK